VAAAEPRLRRVMLGRSLVERLRLGAEVVVLRRDRRAAVPVHWVQVVGRMSARVLGRMGLGVWTSGKSKGWGVMLVVAVMVPVRAMVPVVLRAGADTRVVREAYPALLVGRPPKRRVWSMALEAVRCRRKVSPVGESGAMGPGKSGVVRAPEIQTVLLGPGVAKDWVPGTRRVVEVTDWPLRGIRRRIWFVESSAMEVRPVPGM